ncbi:MAG: hypothetical protein ACI4KM_07480 [Oscillospiraceae bacterium]
MITEPQIALIKRMKHYQEENPNCEPMTLLGVVLCAKDLEAEQQIVNYLDDNPTVSTDGMFAELSRISKSIC